MDVEDRLKIDAEILEGRRQGTLRIGLARLREMLGLRDTLTIVGAFTEPGAYPPKAVWFRLAGRPMPWLPDNTPVPEIYATWHESSPWLSMPELRIVGQDTNEPSL